MHDLHLYRIFRQGNTVTISRQIMFSMSVVFTLVCTSEERGTMMMMTSYF